MRKAVLIFAFAALLAGCGDNDKQPPAPTATAASQAASAEDPALAGYTDGVRRYYSGASLEAAEQPGADAEEKYFQPPRPARARLGETIRLTGANIGLQADVTPTAIKTVQAGNTVYTAVMVEIDNDADGITVYDGELRQASLIYGDGKPVDAVWGVKASCSNTFDAHVRIDVGAKQRGCLLFPASDDQPEQLQIALETVPTDAGGIWSLNAR
jgi:hypothetical protein